MMMSRLARLEVDEMLKRCHFVVPWIVDNISRGKEIPNLLVPRLPCKHPPSLLHLRRRFSSFQVSGSGLPSPLSKPFLALLPRKEISSTTPSGLGCSGVFFLEPRRLEGPLEGGPLAGESRSLFFFGVVILILGGVISS
ncbi:hypothetical protein LIER_40240 [Lithospermum erythrorhizon]|uniref:Uncharacterized protein n=1 Tax=Lithospermum erythrorhizon TaxID=34254 RepID=A0AAV3QT19_LITER